MAVESSDRAPSAKVLSLNNPVVRGAIYQIIVFGLVAAFVVFVARNTAANLAQQNKSTGFDFFWWTAGFDILFSLIPYSRGSYYWQAFLVGLLNTLLVSALGIVLATMLGFTLGIARLSRNWIISRLAVVYIETLRNIPLLLQLFFWYFAVLQAMPAVRNSITFLDIVAINQRGLYVPKPEFGANVIWVVVAVVIAIAAIAIVRQWALRRLEETGQRYPVVWTALAILIGFPAVVWIVSGASVAFSVPVLKGFNYAGGMTLPPEFVALLLGLVLYTAAFIAEIVRAGIQSVSYGQTEAAQALGLKPPDLLRLIIVPQAMRLVVPPLTSQYLNLTKNSSLAVAIGYPDLVSIFMNTTLNQTGRAIEVVFITMLVYLTFSLLTSVFMNWYNARVALVER